MIPSKLFNKSLFKNILISFFIFLNLLLLLHGASGKILAQTPTPVSNAPPPPCKTYFVEGMRKKTTEELIALKKQPGFNNEFKCIEVDTAFGVIGTGPEEFIKKLLGIILSLSGGIALLLIIYSGYTLMASRGDPEKVQGAKETLTSAIVGLLFIIFSIVILQVIGVDILKIPGFK